MCVCVLISKAVFPMFLYRIVRDQTQFAEYMRNPEFLEMVFNLLHDNNALVRSCGQHIFMIIVLIVVYLITHVGCLACFGDGFLYRCCTSSTT